jgi:hypothetical protein
MIKLAWHYFTCWLRQPAAQEEVVDPKTPSDMLEQNGILRPELMMANLIALRISQREAQPQVKLEVLWDIPLAGGRRLEVRYTPGCYEGPGFQRRGESINVGMPGNEDTPYRSILLNKAEQELILEQVRAFHTRCRELYTYNLQCHSQDAALDAIEGLL